MGRRKKVIEVEQEPEDVVIEGDPVIPDLLGSTPDGPRFVVSLQNEKTLNVFNYVLETEDYKEAKEFAHEAVVEFNRIVSIHDRAGSRELRIDPIKGEEFEVSDDGVIKKKPYLRK